MSVSYPAIPPVVVTRSGQTFRGADFTETQDSHSPSPIFNAAALATSTDSRPQLTTPAWLTTLYDYGQSYPPPFAIQGILRGVGSYVRAEDWRALDELLDAIDLRALHPQSLNGILRAPYRFRGNMTRWGAFHNAVAAELERRGENVADWMWGLET